MKNKLLSSGGWFFALMMFLAMAPPLIAQSTLSTNPNATGQTYDGSQIEPSRPEAAVVISHSVSQTILSPNTVACGASGITSANSFIRDFNLAADFSITDDFEITSVEFGVESAGAGRAVAVNLYSATSGLPGGWASKVLEATAVYTTSTADIGSIVSIPIEATIPAGKILYYELKIDDGATVTFYPGSNDEGETAPSYIMAASCGITSPTPFAGIGYPEVHMIMNVVSDPESGGGTPSVYCIPEGTNSSRFINNFSTTGGTQNVSNMNSGFSAGGYGDYYDTHTIAQAQGELVSIEADMEGGTAGLRIWIDWNQDGVFDTTEEVAWNSTGYENTQTGSFMVPANALEGATRMRVVSHWLSTTGDTSPCQTGFTYGEFEDYKFIVEEGSGTGGSGCEWTVTVQDTSWGDEVDWQLRQQGGAVLLQGGGYGNGYFDEQTVTAEGPLEFWITNDGFFGDNTPTYSVSNGTEVLVQGTLNGPTTQTFSDLNCDGGGGTPSVYCIPEGVTATRFIDNFSTTGGTENISNMGSGFSAGGYGDFYDTHTVAQNAGEQVSFSADFEGGTFGFRIWVDWNQDGVFDTAEEVAYMSGGYESSHSGSFTVPADALEGETRMRIVNHWLNTSGNADPCQTGFTYGEFEDYKFIVGEGTSGGGGDECDVVYSGSLDNGLGNLQTLTYANDFVVPANTTMTIESLTLKIFADINDASTLAIYEHGAPGPGAVVEQFSNVAPTSKTFVTVEFGFNVYEVVFDFPQPVEVTAGSSDTIFWVGLRTTQGSEGTSNYWETSDVFNGALAWYSSDGVNWVETTLNDDCAFTLTATCEGGTTGGGGEECDQGVASQASVPQAYNINIGTAFRSAEDFTVDAEGFTLNKITIDVNQQAVPNAVSINIRESNGNAPGAVIHTITGAPDSSEVVGSAFGDPIYHLTFNIDPIELDEGVYWLDPKMSTSTGETVWWAMVDYSSSHGAYLQRSTDDGVTWEQDTDFSGVFTVSGICGSGGGTTGPAGCLETLYAGGNNGSPGGAVYFDVVVGANDIVLNAIDLNISDAGTAFTVDVYTLEGTYVGNETNQAAWTLRTSGSGTSVGPGAGSHADLDDSILMSANTTYGVALVMNTAHSHYYTNGNGTNESYSDANITINLGSATNVPFTGSAFSPRIFNGTLCYGEGGGTGGGADCGQGDDSNGFENGFNITAGGTYRNADDFIVADGPMTIETIELNIFATEPIDSINFNFFADDNGSPGSTIVESVSGLVPYSQVPIGGNFGYTVYNVLVAVDLTFANGHYWMQPEAVSAVAFWEVTSVGSLGEPAHLSEAGGPWMPDEDGSQAVFKLHCDDVTPPEPQCLFDITASVEPITRVAVANIDNSSSPVINGSPALEDFTNIEGDMSQGANYTIALEGNTDGNWTNYFTVWVDWNQDGEWTSDEMYEIGSISNSTGTDGQQATGTISVPANAVLGATTMRVIKSFGSSPTNPCGSYSFGQGEDYTIVVNDDTIGINDNAITGFSYYPNPATDYVNITADQDISSVSVYNVLGQQVLDNKKFANGRVDVSGLPTGTYMFRVTFENGIVETFKVLKN